MENYKVKYANLSFGKAFDYIQTFPNAYGMRLPSWSKDVVIRVQVPDKDSYMTAPYLYVDSRYGRVPWKETMIEMFSCEWEVVEVETKKKEVNLEKRNKTYKEIVDNFGDTSGVVKKYYGEAKDNKKPKCNHDCANCQFDSKEVKKEEETKENFKKLKPFGIISTDEMLFELMTSLFDLD